MACAADVVGAAMARGPDNCAGSGQDCNGIIIVFRPGAPRLLLPPRPTVPHAGNKFEYTACTMQPS